MNVGQFCNGRIVKASKSTPLAEVARLMNDEHVGAVIVTDGSYENAPVAGILTDRDIVSIQLDKARDLATMSAGDAMTRNVLTLLKSESIDGAIAHMRARNVRRAPVVTPEGAPLGLVSVDDLIAQVSLKLGGIAAILAQQARSGG
jgi:CBS domain-containing protein